MTSTKLALMLLTFWSAFALKKSHDDIKKGVQQLEIAAGAEVEIAADAEVIVNSSKMTPTKCESGKKCCCSCYTLGGGNGVVRNVLGPEDEDTECHSCADWDDCQNKEIDGAYNVKSEEACVEKDKLWRTKNSAEKDKICTA